jgi:N-acetylglucosamine-6-sulfatase
VWTGEGDWYVEYEGGEKELYDVGADPYQLENLAGTRPEAEAALSARLDDLKTCARNSCRLAEDGSK